MLLVLLRVSIGWHFLYEGLEKYQSLTGGRFQFAAFWQYLTQGPAKVEADRPGGASFSQPYLLNASGPLRDYFRGLVDDPDGLSRLNQTQVAGRWEAELKASAEHYGFSQEQRAKAEAKLSGDGGLKADLRRYFEDAETRRKIEEYKNKLDELKDPAKRPKTAFERERRWQKQRELAGTAQALTAPIDAWTASWHKYLRELLTPEQKSKLPPEALVPTATRRDWQVMLALVVIGGLLTVGLFSRTAAVGAVVMLAMFYLSMPPWPGLPENPRAEGHYLYVNKNLIEMVAALALATLPTGRWLGVDALIRGLLTRRLSYWLTGEADDVVEREPEKREI